MTRTSLSRTPSIRVSVVSCRVTMQCRHEARLEKRWEVADLSGWSTPIRSISRWWLTLAVIITTLVLAPAGARAQRVSGFLGVSATVLPPIIKKAAELTSFHVQRNGIAHLETTTPVAGAV